MFEIKWWKVFDSACHQQCRTSKRVERERAVWSRRSREDKSDQQHASTAHLWSEIAVALSQRLSNHQRGHLHCSYTRSTSLAGPVGRRCTRPRCVRGGRHVCTRNPPSERHHLWCSPSAPPERDGNEPRWMSEGPEWSCSEGRKETGRRSGQKQRLKSINGVLHGKYTRKICKHNLRLSIFSERGILNVVCLQVY